MNKKLLIGVGLVVVVGLFIYSGQFKSGAGSLFILQNGSHTVDSDFGLMYQIEYSDGTKSVVNRSDNTDIVEVVRGNISGVSIVVNFVDKNGVSSYSKDANIDVNFTGLFAKKCQQENPYENYGRVTVKCDLSSGLADLEFNSSWEDNSKIQNRMLFKVVSE